MTYGTISSKWFSLSKHGRIDADFWLRVLEIVRTRGVDHNDLDAVREIVSEVENTPESQNNA